MSIKKRGKKKRRKTYTRPIIPKKYAYIASSLLLLAALILSITNPWVGIRTVSIKNGEICLIPFNTLKLEDLESTSTKTIVRGVKAIYVKCNETSCPRQEKAYNETVLSPKNTVVQLGPSIVQNFVLDTDTLGSIAPSAMESLENGTLNLTWNYPTLQARASISIIVEKLNLVFSCPKDDCKQVVEELGNPSTKHLDKLVYQLPREDSAKTINVGSSILFKKELYYQGYGCELDKLEIGIKLNIAVLLLLLAIITTILSRVRKTLR